MAESTDLTRERISEIARGFMASRALLSAYELGIFEALAAGEKNSLEVSWAIGADPRATDRLLRALVTMQLVELRPDRKFALSHAAAEFLVPGQPGFMGDLGHINNLWKSWSTLTEAVRQGEKIAGPQAPPRDPAWIENFITAMHVLSIPFAPDTIAQMDLPDARRMLDVGGGPGTYALAFVRAGEGRTATVFDLPDVVPLTRRFVEENDLSDKIDYVSGDMNKDELPSSNYDVVFISAIIHMLSPEQNLALMQKAVRATAVGGSVVVQDFVMDNDRIRPPHGAMFALNMLVGTSGGDTYTAAEITEWMNASGLPEVRTCNTTRGTSLVIGTKPA
jgi:SAM-dependent methyltransferase